MRSGLCLILMLLMAGPLFSRGLFDSEQESPVIEQTEGALDSDPAVKSGPVRVLGSSPSNGEIKQLALEEGILYLNGNPGTSGTIKISWVSGSESDQDLLKKAETYSYAERRRPDGFIKELSLFTKDELIAWVGSGQRGGDILEGTLSFSEEEESIYLHSSDHSWMLELGRDIEVDWGEGEYTARLGEVVRGKHIDQPELSFSLILLKR